MECFNVSGVVAGYARWRSRVSVLLKLLYLVTEDWYFLSHRTALAQAAHQAGAEVYVMTRLMHGESRLRKMPFRIIDWPSMRRGSTNPLREAKALWEVCRTYRDIQPDLVHHIAIKPALYGGLAARLTGNQARVATIAGLGEVFTSESAVLRSLRRLVQPLLSTAMGGGRARVIAQNDAIGDQLAALRISSARKISIIRGSGIDPAAFPPTPEAQGTPVIVLASRMLRSKGVEEFVEAARIVRHRGISARFVLVGDTDRQNPSGIESARLKLWADSGDIEWWGHREDIAQVLSQANIVCLPSYAEGVPRILIEAASCARAIVTTDVPGCRDVVRHRENGLLVPARDSAALAEAVSLLIQEPELRRQMGTRGRQIVLEQFAEQKIIAETFTIYRELLGEKWPMAPSIG
jgi:glycosyltransferase involved in cell wall biosynthesis